MFNRWKLMLYFAAIFIAASASAQAGEIVRIAILKTGTVAWELDTIIHHGLDEKHGIDLTIVPVAGKLSADVMLAAGQADVIVTDWIWVSRQRNSGADYTFAPYSKQVGSIVVKDDSTIKSLADLKGKKIGVAGGPTDKSWVLFQALARKDFALDLSTQAEAVFAAPPLLNEKFAAGEIDAVITFWHFAAKLRADGGRDIAVVADAAKSLGLDIDTALLGYVYSEKWSATHGNVALKLIKASAEAKALLAVDEKEWERLRPMMNVKTVAEFAALKAGFRAGIQDYKKPNEKAAANMFAVLAKIGGVELVGDKPTLAAGTFAKLN